MVRKLNKKGKIVIIISSILVFILLLFLTFKIVYSINTGAVSKNTDEITFEIVEGDTYYSISSKLKNSKLIKSESFYKLYIKLNNPSVLKKGTYSLNQTMTVKDIVNIIKQGGFKKGEMITFKEGLNMRQIASLITSKTKNTEEDIYSILNDEEYLDSLIQKYWFITEDVKNEKIYYSLEGYLFPNTYEFFIDEVSVKEIFNKMLDEMEKQLKPYKEDIEKSKYSIHELLTMASIVELEGKSISDRNEVAGVFYNRLKSNNTLGSDVTTYYGAKVNMSDRDLYQKETNTANDYNTRNASLAGKLPIGPICNPSISSIKAALYPKETNNYYFVADKNGKTYFTKTYNEHLRTVSKLKSEGLWYTY